MTPTGFSLDGKIALVTGGVRGLGLEIAKALANAGAFVLINGRSQESLERWLFRNGIQCRSSCRSRNR
ncbi:hypothetical protein WA1_33110 [Scytonema hofmannii PCC 7110]|uniref:Gluconate 5-dehydrogenase n=1 Tax=Scytonema hofmannii PCC 7110 TaxID=128403 RepID=A0A139X2C4_9CYAN|nr:SDR family NAD(P)-dependent oxidoreductase [Scytonema hofmannii]KYC38857.1 hypothetical protein WA1_33110 [Scytonema hofmannii PCC 7110]